MIGYTKLKNKYTGQEVLVETVHWLSIKGVGLIQIDAIKPEFLKVWEAVRILYEASTVRIIDNETDLQWEAEEDLKAEVNHE
jgi:hypothetical protein